MTRDASGITVHCAHDELLDVVNLIPNPRNPNKHGDKQVAMLAKIIRHQGWRAPITVSKRSGFIVTGHGRLEAAKLLQVQTVPVDFQDFATEADEWAHLIADNRIAELAEIDSGDLSGLLKEIEAAGVDLDLAGFDAEALVEVEGFDVPESDVDAEPQIDRAAELQKEWGTATGQLWKLGDHRLLCGDSTNRDDVERVMGGTLADCVFTSPPYAVGVDYGATYEDSIENLRAMLPKLAASWMAVVREGGFAVINFADIISGSKISESETPCEFPMALEYFPAFRKAGWSLWARRIWCKPNARTFSPWVMVTNRASSDWEHVWTWKKIGAAIVNRVNGETQSANGWFDTTSETGVKHGKDEHGAGMAAALPNRMLPIHSRRGGVVFEPFSGTGTTLIAAEGLGRKCYGLEISPAYCAVILQRFKDATGKTPALHS